MKQDLLGKNYVIFIYVNYIQFGAYQMKKKINKQWHCAKKTA